MGRLRQQGIECWFDESNIPVGEAFVARLGEALRKASGFLLMDSAASRQSYWVLREATTAFRYKREGRFYVMIRISLDSGTSSASIDWDGSFDFNDNICEQLGTFLRKWAVSPEFAQIPDRDTSIKTMQRIDFEQPRNWIGRQDELRDLDNWWFGEKIGAWVSGLGGIGKSGLIQTWITALEYLGYDTEISPSIFFIYGRSIRYPLLDVEGFRDWKADSRGKARLIVLNGLDESSFKNAAHDLVSVAIAIGARALVASRTKVPELLSEYFVNLDLPAFSRRDSEAFIRQLGIPEKDGHKVAEALDGNLLAEALDGNPLALHLFSNLVATYGSTGALEELNKTSRRLEAGTSPKEFPIGDALQMSFNSRGQGVEKSPSFTVGMNRAPWMIPCPRSD